MVGYNIYRSEQKGKGYVLLNSSQNEIFYDETPVPGKTYYYVVSSVYGEFNETAYSNEISIKVPAPQRAETTLRSSAVPDQDKPTEMKPARLLFRISGYRERSARDISKIRRVRDVAVDEVRGRIYISSLDYGGVLVFDMDGGFIAGLRKDGERGEKRFQIAGGDRKSVV